jgi:predicted dehydrogenase
MIGAGYFAQLHAEAWSRIPGTKIVAVADLAPDKAQQFAARWQIVRAYAVVEETLEKEKPDFVDIVTRPESYLALVKFAAERGLQITCQKPMATTWEECLGMVKLCADMSG